MAHSPRTIVRREPVAVAAVIRAVAYILLAAGLDVDPELLVTTIVPAVEVITATITRARVTPVS